MAALLALRSEDLRGLCASLNLTEDDPLAARLRHKRCQAPETMGPTISPRDPPPPPSHSADDEMLVEDIGCEEVVSGGFIGGPVDVKVTFDLHQHFETSLPTITYRRSTTSSKEMTPTSFSPLVLNMAWFRCLT